MSSVVVVGQGYVGLPLALAAAGAGHHVTGVDSDVRTVQALNEARSHVLDVDAGHLRKWLDTGNYVASADYKSVSEADLVVICVPTPYHHDAPDLSFVEAAGVRVAERLQPGTLVVLESTTYPGTTEELLLPILEKTSGLRAAQDFDLAFSPERIDPGNAHYGLHNTPKIVGGHTAEAAARAREFYESFVSTVVIVSTPRAAEMAKLLENTFRHINIALANEMAVLCRDLDIDVWEVIDAAATKPFGFMPFYPGPGVGGHCIPVDPMYLSWRIKQFGGAAKFIDLARDVNAGMPLYVVSRLQDLLNERERSLKGARILVLGVAYKADIGDVRESPATRLIELLFKKGALVDYADRYVNEFYVLGRRLTGVSITEHRVRQSDCVLVLAGHSGVDYEMIAREAALVFDTRRVVPGGAGVHRL
jgi:UDP-N-acetyl-D-glucosamine dehydrogenase